MTIKIKKILSFVVISLLLSSCTNTQNLKTTGYSDNDPFEPYNRVMFDFNTFFDEMLLSPVAEGYREITPLGLRMAMRNFFANLEEPLNFVNSLLQGDIAGARDNIFRLIVNTTYGMAGLNDVASDVGLPPHDTDFGQTLAVWGVGEGPYVVLPFIGGYNLRDAFGIGGDFLVGPLTWILWDVNYTWAYITTPDIIVIREKYIDIIDNMKKDSLDLYITTRESLRQSRRATVNKTLGIKASDTQYDFDMDEFDFEFEED